MIQQCSFDFLVEAPLETEDFVKSPANEEAARWIENWPDAMPSAKGVAVMPSSHALMLCGETGSGKTHLATMWQQRVGAKFIALKEVYKTPVSILMEKSRYLIVEECHKLYDETAFFHFFNGVKEYGGFVLFTSQLHPAQMRIRLSDLRSRLYAIPVIEIYVPDEGLIASLLVKYFSERQLRVDMEVVNFIAMRLDRSFDAIKLLVEKLDKRSLHEQCSITIPFVKKVLTNG